MLWGTKRRIPRDGVLPVARRGRVAEDTTLVRLGTQPGFWKLAANGKGMMVFGGGVLGFGLE